MRQAAVDWTIYTDCFAGMTGWELKAAVHTDLARA
jgi:hypothetical protein